MFKSILSYFCMLSIALICLGFGSVVYAGTNTYTVDGLTYEITDKGQIMSIQGDVTDINIPETINGITVTRIKYGAFPSKMKKLHIPATVAFDCYEEDTYPRNTDNWWRGLSTDENLVELSIDPSNTSVKMVDGVLYSYDGTHLLCYPRYLKSESYRICDGVTHISRSVFYDNQCLKSIEMPDSVKVVEECNFLQCRALSNVKLSEALESIGRRSFCSLDFLESINLPEGLSTIGG